jgi:hypothetical protein
MYEIVMLRLSEEKVAPLICNQSQTSEILDFVKNAKGEEPELILEQIESNFDCREVDYSEEDPFGFKKTE